MKMSKMLLCTTLFVFFACKDTNTNYEYNLYGTEQNVPPSILAQAVENNVSSFHFTYDTSKDRLYSNDMKRWGGV